MGYAAILSIIWRCGPRKSPADIFPLIENANGQAAVQQSSIKLPSILSAPPKCKGIVLFCGRPVRINYEKAPDSGIF